MKCVLLIALLVVAAVAMEADVDASVSADADKPRRHRHHRRSSRWHRPRIVGAVAGHGTQHLRVVVVPKGDPRARAPNPFLPKSAASTASAAGAPVLKSSAPMNGVTAAQLVSCMPGLSSSKANTVLPFLNAAQAEAQINTCDRTAAWLAQLGHESGSLLYMEEIASGAAYEGRKDLGNTQPGDGKRFKGRGPIQLTGRANYAAAGKALGLDLIDNPTSVATNAVGFRTSAWFWSSHNLNALADQNTQASFTAITKKINGGTNGAADRNMRWGKCKTALKCSGAAAPADPFPQCTAKGGKCLTTPCSGTQVHNLCGSGAPVCCVPKALQSAAPATNAAYQPCINIKGTCQTTPCSGTQVHNLCGSGAPVCCVPKGALPPAPVVGASGVDVSTPLTASAASCLKTNHYTWVSVRGSRSNGKVDTNAPASLRVAAAAGYGPSALSVYIFPFTATTDASSGGKQVTAMWNSLASVKDLFGTIWLDIEAAKWETTAQNQKFFESMVSACKATGKTCGVYTSKTFWTSIMGSTYSGGSSLPLWYPHYQSPAAASMSDFSSFGGWTQPWAKQYKETTTVCGVAADINVMNSAFQAPAGAVVKSAAPVPSGVVLKSGAPVLKAAAPAASASVTAAQLVACMPGLSSAKANTVLPFLNAAQAQASINTCRRKAAWLAQLGHESGSLVYMQELASGAAYEGRKDLGNTQPGDGKRFKGRGPIQLTGRANYAAAGKALGLDLINNPTSVATNAVGFRTSAWFWTTHGLNALADQGTAAAFTSITKKINGGTNGAADRNTRWAKCKAALKC